MRCLYCDQRMWICSFHGAYHRDCHFYYFDIVSGFGPRLCSSRWGDICLFEKWQSSAKNAANFRVSTKTCPAYQFFSKSEKQDGTLFLVFAVGRRKSTTRLFGRSSKIDRLFDRPSTFSVKLTQIDVCNYCRTYYL